MNPFDGFNSCLFKHSQSSLESMHFFLQHEFNQKAQLKFPNAFPFVLGAHSCGITCYIYILLLKEDVFKLCFTRRHKRLGL